MIVVVTVCGAAWIDICEDVVGVWWTVDVSDGNGWSENDLEMNGILRNYQWTHLSESESVGYDAG